MNLPSTTTPSRFGTLLAARRAVRLSFVFVVLASAFGLDLPL